VVEDVEVESKDAALFGRDIFANKQSLICLIKPSILLKC